jgi:hypothetical protein
MKIVVIPPSGGAEFIDVYAPNGSLPLSTLQDLVGGDVVIHPNRCPLGLVLLVNENGEALRLERNRTFNDVLGAAVICRESHGDFVGIDKKALSLLERTLPEVVVPRRVPS